MSARVPVRTRVGTGILLVAALSLGRVITERLPGDDWASRPFTSAAAVGSTADLRTGDVVVTKVSGSTVVVSPTGTAMLSPAVWIVVDYTWTPRSGTDALGSVLVRTPDGSTYDRLRGRNTGSCGASLPGLPFHCQAAVEVPVASAPGARLELSPVFLTAEYDSLAVLDLGITPAKAKEWAASKTPIRLPLSEPGR